MANNVDRLSRNVHRIVERADIQIPPAPKFPAEAVTGPTISRLAAVARFNGDLQKWRNDRWSVDAPFVTEAELSRSVTKLSDEQALLTTRLNVGLQDLSELEARVTVLETSVTNIDARVTILESAVGTAIPHTILDAAVHTDSVTQTVTRGALIYGNATPKWDLLTIGPPGTYVRSDGIDTAWSSVVATEITGVIPVSSGGTNTGSWTAGSVIFAGAGGTSLAEDNANLFWDNTNNRLGIGMNAPLFPLHVGVGLTTVANNLAYFTVTRTAQGPLENVIEIRMDANPTSYSANSSYTGMDVNCDSKASNTVGMGGLTGLNFKANHRGTGTADTAYGVKGASINIGAGTITDARGFSSRIRNLNAAGTIVAGYNFYLETPSLIGPITNQYGLYLNNMGGAGATNIYGIYNVGQSGASTNNYFIYSVSGLSYFGGNVGIGIAAPSTIFQVSAAASPTIKITDSDFGTGIADGLDIQMSGAQCFFWNYENGRMGFATNNQEKMTIAASGNVGIGTITPPTQLTVKSTSASDPRGIMTAQYSTDAEGADMNFRKARGTETVPVVIVTGDVLGRLRFSGYDGSNYLQMASIDVGSGGTIASTRVPTYMAFSTATNVAPSVLTEAIRIINNQFVGIGTSTPTLARLDVRENNNDPIGWGSTGTQYGRLSYGASLASVIAAQSTFSLQLSGGGGGGIRINTTGQVGIGTTVPGVLLDVGLAGTRSGVIRVAGSISGNVTIQPAAIAGTWTLTLPITDGNANEFLLTDGAGVTSWSKVALTSGVSGILPTANGGTNHGNFTASSVLFAGPGGLSIEETNNSLFWDYTLFRFGIGNGNPQVLLDLGLAGTTAGIIRMAGLTSGNVTIQTAAIAGTWTLTLPVDDGNLGDLLTTNGSGVASWVAPSAGVTFANPTALVSTAAVNGVATTAMRSDAAPAIDQAMGPTWTGGHTWDLGTSAPADDPLSAISLSATALVAAGFRDSHAFALIGQSFDASPHSLGWRQWVNVTSNAGASSWVLQRNIDLGTYVTKLRVYDTGLVEVGPDAVGVTQLDTYGLVILNATPALAGAANQQWSPPLRFEGQGWKTDAVAGTMKAEFRQYIAPVQGTAAPTVYWVMEHSVNDVAYTELMRADSTGYVRITKNALASIDTTLGQSAFGLQINNDTAATAVITTQDAPPVIFKLAAWNSSALTSQDWRWRMLAKGVTVAGTTTSYLRIDSGISGSNFGNPLVLYSSGGASLGSVLAEQPLGVLSVQVGFRIAGGATSGQFLRGNGTNFISAAIGPGDIPLAAVTAHALLSTTHSDTVAAVVARGALVVGKNASPTWERLVMGTAGQVLTVVGSDVVWATPSAGAAHDILSATHTDTLAAAVSQGSLIIGNATPKWAELIIDASNSVLKNDGTNVVWGKVDLTSATDVTGLLPIAGGGTNQGSYTDMSVIYYDSASDTLTEDNTAFRYDASINRLTLRRDASGGGIIPFELKNLGNGASTGIAIDFRLGTSVGGDVSSAQINTNQETAWTGTASTQNSSLGFYTALAGAAGVALDLRSSGSVVCGKGDSTTTRIGDFLHITPCAGTPTGVPTLFAGRVPMTVDDTSAIKKLWVYAGGAWVGVVVA